MELIGPKRACVMVIRDIEFVDGKSKTGCKRKTLKVHLIPATVCNSILSRVDLVDGVGGGRSRTNDLPRSNKLPSPAFVTRSYIIVRHSCRGKHGRNLENNTEKKYEAAQSRDICAPWRGNKD